MQMNIIKQHLIGLYLYQILEELKYVTLDLKSLENTLKLHNRQTSKSYITMVHGVDTSLKIVCRPSTFLAG